MRRFLKVLAAVAATVAFAVAPAFVASQGVNVFGLQVQPLAAESVSQVITAVDTDQALFIKYVGTGDSAQVAIAAAGTGDLTFTLNGAAYDGFECPVSGALGGIIDVSDTACDTVGEVVDVVNNDINRKFVAYIAAGLRSYSSNASFLADAADNDVTSPDGEVVLWDSSVLDDTGILLTPAGVVGGQDYFGKNPRGINKNPRAGFDTVLLFAQENITNAGTVGNFVAYCVVEDYVSGSESVQTLYQEAGAGTGTLGKIDEFINAGGLRCRDGKLFVTILASGADTSAVLLHGYGFRFKR